MKPDATLGGVVIGRNEGERLRDCLASLLADLDAVVYVDSGSTDNSLAIADEMGVETVALDAAVGFTAAQSAKHRRPTPVGTVAENRIHPIR